MGISKYKISLIAFLYISIVITILIFLIYEVGYNSKGGKITPLIPIENYAIEKLIITLILYPLAAIIGAILGGYLFSPLFLIFYKKIFGRKMIFGIQETPEIKVPKILRGFFPALIAINFSVILSSNEELSKFLLYSEAWEYGESVAWTYIPTLTISLVFTIFAGMVIFVPIWFILDAGLVYSNREKVIKGKGEVIEGRSLGGWFLGLTKGYAGIGGIIAFYQLIFLYLTQMKNSPGPLITNSFFIIPLPIFLTILIIPSLIILEITKKFRIKYVRGIAKKLGITDYVEVKFEKMNKYNENLKI
ncbi:MAG: hypothetical protein ACFFA0_08190 [Promethearchaeota archaeon]